MEQTIFVIRPSISPVITLYIITLLVLVFFVFLMFASQNINFLFFGILFQFITIDKHLGRNFTIYTLTTENIKIRAGIIGKTQIMIPLAKVQNVAFNYSIIQRLYGIGNLLIESASDQGAIPFTNIEKPEEYSKKILDATKNYQKNNSQP